MDFFTKCKSTNLFKLWILLGIGSTKSGDRLSGLNILRLKSTFQEPDVNMANDFPHGGTFYIYVNIKHALEHFIFLLFL